MRNTPEQARQPGSAHYFSLHGSFLKATCAYAPPLIPSPHQWQCNASLLCERNWCAGRTCMAHGPWLDDSLPGAFPSSPLSRRWAIGRAWAWCLAGILLGEQMSPGLVPIDRSVWRERKRRVCGMPFARLHSQLGRTSMRKDMYVRKAGSSSS